MHDQPQPLAPAPEEESQSSAPSAKKELLSTIGILATAFCVAILIITFIFRSYQVDGPSMRNTLENNDKLIIWKVQRTWARITRHAYIPQRGDIVVFDQKGLSQFGQDDSKQIIKRVIALPGERIVLADGKYTVYNSTHPDGFNPDQTLKLDKAIVPTSGSLDLTLNKDQIFVSGDNRPDSLDSRSFGPIDANQIVGKLVLRAFPLSSAEVF